MMFGAWHTPYQKMGGSFIRAYTSITTKKNDLDVKIGYVVGYAEDVVGYKVYFPREHITKFVSDVRVTENIVYRDRQVGKAKRVIFIRFNLITMMKNKLRRLTRI